jgi:hypothetical protein
MPLELARQAIKPLGDGGLALVGGVRRQPRCERCRDDGRLGHTFLGSQLVEALGVFVRNE